MNCEATYRLLKFGYCIFIISIFWGCGVPEEKYNALKKENAALKIKIDTLTSQLDDLKFGANPLLEKAKISIENKEFEVARTLLTKIIDKYYNSNEAVVANKLLKAVNLNIEQNFFDIAKKSDGISQLEAYVQQYPTGIFLNEARYLLEERKWQSLTDTSSKLDFENFINEFPNSIHLTDATNSLIKCQVNDVFKTANYKQLPPLQPTYNSYSESYTYSDNSKITIQNNTNYPLTILYSGPEQRKLTVANNQIESIWLKNGSYRIVTYVIGAEVSTYAAQSQLNGEYAASYSISTTSIAPYSNNSSYNNQYQYKSSNNYNWKSADETPTYRSKSDYPVYETRIGAICCDGSRSNATGRGACSHHGGVCQWLYK